MTDKIEEILQQNDYCFTQDNYNNTVKDLVRLFREQSPAKEYKSQQINPESYKVTGTALENTFETLLDAFWSDMRTFLLKKDKEYGSRYLNPLNVFCELSPMDRLNARLDEKLGRAMAGNTDDNTLDDILGLLIHRKIIQKKNEQ